MNYKRSNRIDLRLYPEAKEKLQAAGSLRHKSVSKFILDSALGAADEVLADRYQFSLNAEQWEAFQAALDRPPRIEKLEHHHHVDFFDCDQVRPFP